MVIGIILAGIFIMLSLNVIVKQLHNDRIKRVLRRIHRWLAIAFVMLAMIHLVLTWGLRRQRPIGMYALGFVMLAAALATLGSCIFRRQLKRKWLLIHRTAALVILVCLALHVYLGFSSLNEYKSEVAQLTISQVDLSGVADGEYTGECNVGYIYAKVLVSVKNAQIEDITLVEHRTEKGRPAEVIVTQMMEEQSTKVDAVSGATNSSKVIMRAVENALEQQVE